MMMRRSTTCVMMLCAAAVLLAGCSRSPRVNFYTLNSVSMPEATAPTRPISSIEVGPVSVPGVVDQPQLVLHVGVNRVEILEMQRWASPLRSEIPRIIAEDLALLLKPARVLAYPTAGGVTSDYQVQVDIMRFEGTQGEGVTVDALWSLRRPGGGPPKPGHTVAREAAAGSSFDAVVAAYSRALATVSREIAQALQVEDSLQR
jgi:uncharacterized lipoprotein YmbA